MKSIIEFTFTKSGYREISLIQRIAFSIVTFLFPSIIGREIVSQEEFEAREIQRQNNCYQAWLSYHHKFVEKE